MSELQVNKISKYSGNNVAMDNSLKLKSYDTSGRNALTSVAGDMIYNTDDNKPNFYNGSEWKTFETPTFSISYLIIAGGGGGGQRYAGGAGAGGYRNSYASETSGGGGATETPLTIFKDGSTEYVVTVGAGGTTGGAFKGNDSVFNIITSLGGGSGDAAKDGGCGAGGSASTVGPTAGTGTAGQGYGGGAGSATNYASAGGGGTGAVGTASTSGHIPGDGGAGTSSSITGSAVTRGGGGGGGSNSYPSVNGSGGSGGGGDGRAAGTANTGGGGGASYQGYGSAGGSGVVILRWTTADATIGGTRTGLTDGGVQTDGSDSYIAFTAGTGTITFS